MQPSLLQTTDWLHGCKDQWSKHRCRPSHWNLQMSESYEICNNNIQPFEEWELMHVVPVVMTDNFLCFTINDVERSRTLPGIG